MKNRILLLVSFLFLLFSLGKSQVKITYTMDNHSRVNGEYYPDSLTVKRTFDSASNIATETITNPCFSRPSPIITPSGSTTICLGDSVVLIADSAFSYLWSNGDTTQSIIVKQAGSFAVTTFGSLHCSKTSDTVIVKVNTLPIVSIIASDSTSFCSGKNITLSSSFTGKYLWNTGDTTINVIADTIKNYVLQYTDSNGCKATASQQITVYPKLNAAFTPNALAQCDGNNFVFTNTSTLNDGDKTFLWDLGDGLSDTSTNQSHTYGSSGSYSVTLLVTSDYNCKDSVTKNITVYPNPTPVISGASIVCNNTYAIYTTLVDSASIYTWVVNGGSLTTGQGTDSTNINWGADGSGTVAVTDSVKATGCKTTTNPYIVTINSATNSTTDTGICRGMSYSFNGNNYDSAGTYLAHLTNALGCDSAATLHLSIKQPSTSRIDTSICKGSVYLLNGTSYDSTGIYVQHLSNAVGCDSIATLNLIVNTSTSSNTDTSICPSALPYTWNGNNYDSSGTYTTHLINKMGCDSIATLNLKINANSISTTDTNICPTALPYVWNGNSYDSTGVYTIHLTNSKGCDSAATLHLIVNIATTSTDSIRTCNSYLWNGITYTTSGTYTFKINNIKGCDSVATLHLVIDTITTHTDSIKACNSYVWNNITYTTSGTYTFNTSNSKGCDSIATLILVMNNSTSSNTNVSVCPSVLPYLWNNNSYITGGTYTVHLTNKTGCDSAATLNLIVNSTSVSTTDISICPIALPYHWNNNTYPTGGTYTVHLTNINGCDSTATLHLTVNTVSSSNTDTSICPSALPFIWNTQSFSGAGTYTVHLFNITGCDSIATLHLSIKTISKSITNASICFGGTYTFNGTVYTATGTYAAHLINSVGCDSTAMLNLIVNTSTSSTTIMSICSSVAPYKWNGNNYTTSGIYTVHLNNIISCDSAATLNLTVNNPTISSSNIIICGSYLWNGTTYTTSGVYTYTTTNNRGCDSTAILNLIINQPTTSITNISICSNQLPYNWNGLTFNAAGTQTAHLKNAKNCDSSAALILTVSTTSAPSISILTSSSNICTGILVTFTATSINGGTAPVYQWKLNGANVGTNSNTYTVTSLSNNDSVWCVLTSNFSCATIITATSNKIKMVVRTSPVLSPVKNAAGISVTSVIMCTINGSIGLYNTYLGGIWSSSNNGIATAINGAAQVGLSSSGLITAIANGTTAVTYTLIASNGCSSAVSATIFVDAVSAPNATSGSNKVCVGNTTTLNNSTIIPTGCSGVWSCVGGKASINTSGIVTGLNTGTASVVYTVTNSNGCFNNNSFAITIYSLPAIPAIGYAAGTINPQTGIGGGFCIGRTFTVVGTPSGGIWSTNSSGVLTVNATTGVTTIVKAGNTVITYTYTDVNGCSSSRTITGNAVSCPLAKGITSENKLDEKFYFTMFPNPAKNVVTISTSSAFSTGRIFICNILGQVVKSELLSLGDNEIHISNLSKGVYLVKVVVDTNETTKPRKLIIE